MKFASTNQDDVTIITLTGGFDASAVEEFTHKINFLIDYGTRKFVIDLSQINSIDSSGLGCLVNVMRRLKQQNGQVKIASPTPRVRTVFELTKLHRVFDIYDDVHGATTNFS